MIILFTWEMEIKGREEEGKYLKNYIHMCVCVYIYVLTEHKLFLNKSVI